MRMFIALCFVVLMHVSAYAETEVPLGKLSINNEFTKGIMTTKYDEDGNLRMTIKTTSTFGVNCAFDGMCDVDGKNIECMQAFRNSDKIVTINGTISKNGYDFSKVEDEDICRQGGVISGRYTLVK